MNRPEEVQGGPEGGESKASRLPGHDLMNEPYSKVGERHGLSLRYMTMPNPTFKRRTKFRKGGKMCGNVRDSQLPQEKTEKKTRG